MFFFYILLRVTSFQTASKTILQKMCQKTKYVLSYECIILKNKQKPMKLNKNIYNKTLTLIVCETICFFLKRFTFFVFKQSFPLLFGQSLTPPKKKICLVLAAAILFQFTIAYRPLFPYFISPLYFKLFFLSTLF